MRNVQIDIDIYFVLFYSRTAIDWSHAKACIGYITGFFNPPDVVKMAVKKKKTVKSIDKADKTRNPLLLLADGVANAAICIYRNDLILYASPGMAKLTGYKSEELVGSVIWNLVNPEYRTAVRDHYAAWQNGGSAPPVNEFIIDSKNGVPCWISLNVGHTEYEDEPAVIGIAYDITTHKNTVQALLESESKYRQLVESVQGGIWVIDHDARTTYVNPCMAAMLGYSVEEMLGKHLYSFMDEAGIDICMRNLERREQGLKEQHDFEFLRKDGRRIYANFETSQIMDDCGNKIGTIAGVMDITDRRRTEEIIMQMAYHDALTGLPNRRLFKDRLKMAMAHANRYKEKVGVLMIDLDRFKRINDTLGHSVGDILLKQVSGRLRQLVRTNDTVARMGGDEFMVVLPEMSDGKSAGLIAQKIIDSMKEPFMCNDHKLMISTSIGIALYPSDGRDCELLIKNADVAMYEAKHSGSDSGAYQYYAPEGRTVQ